MGHCSILRGGLWSLIDFKESDAIQIAMAGLMESHFEHMASRASSTCMLSEQTVVCSRARTTKYQKINSIFTILFVFTTYHEL